MKVSLSRGDPAVEHSGYWFKYDVMLRPSDLCVRLQFVDRAIGAQVALREDAGYAKGRADLSCLSGRKFSENIAGGRVDVGFVECHPAITQVAQDFNHAARESFEKDGCIGMKEGALFFEPARIGEMVQADDGADAALG